MKQRIRRTALARTTAEDNERTSRRAPADGSARGWGETAKGGRKENGWGYRDTGVGQGRATMSGSRGVGCSARGAGFFQILAEGSCGIVFFG
jgi:hypothetical protein